VKREVAVGGAIARLDIAGETFVYQRADGAQASGPFRVTPVDSGSYLVSLGSRTYRVALGPLGEVSVNGRNLSMEVFDPRNLRASGPTRPQQGRVRISAPMPGKVIRVLVMPGDSVVPGQGLVVVEAMKMQNEMKAPQAGHVTEVRTEAGETVLAGDVLIVIE